MSDRVLILVATMSGAADMAAGAIADHLEDMGVDTRILMMDKASVATLAAAKRVIVCSSTYGVGEVPDNGKALFDALEAERPDLSSVTYSVFALGSSIYPQTFCFGGKKFDELFAALGARRVGTRFEHDDRCGVPADEAAVDWIEASAEAITA